MLLNILQCRQASFPQQTSQSVSSAEAGKSSSSKFHASPFNLSAFTQQLETQPRSGAAPQGTWWIESSSKPECCECRSVLLTPPRPLGLASVQLVALGLGKQKGKQGANWRFQMQTFQSAHGRGLWWRGLTSWHGSILALRFHSFSFSDKRKLNYQNQEILAIFIKFMRDVESKHYISKCAALPGEGGSVCSGAHRPIPSYRKHHRSGRVDRTFVPAAPHWLGNLGPLTVFLHFCLHTC